MPKRFSVEWFSDCATDDEKVKRDQMIRAASPTLELLAKILRRKKKALDLKYDYNSPAWQYMLAEDQGRKQEIDGLLKLLTPVLEENEDE